MTYAGGTKAGPKGTKVASGEVEVTGAPRTGSGKLVDTYKGKHDLQDNRSAPWVGYQSGMFR